MFQLRDEFDSGKDVVLDETQNPHEVGALLKEYFRDLPEPLLTRDLYSPFVATRSKLSETMSFILNKVLNICDGCKVIQCYVSIVQNTDAGGFRYRGKIH